MFRTGVRGIFAGVALLLALGFGVPSGAVPVDRATAQPTKPNIIFVMADDLDKRSVGHMPNLRSQIAEKGITFENAFVTNSLCCPSRASILRGQYSHNHEILGNKLPRGGFEKFRQLGREKSTIATWLRSGGYRTALVGKYFNDYDARHVPPGWSKWYAQTKPGYTDFQLNENGKFVSYEGERNYKTDVLARKAADFVRTSSNKPNPFFLYLSPNAPHEPATSAPRHENSLSNVELPDPPSFNERDVSDKPKWVRDNRRLTKTDMKKMRKHRHDRLRSMLAVDEMIGRLVNTLKANDELDNTYIFFFSDNGFHMGEHRMGMGKWTAYEEDIHVPLIVRGPGVSGDRTSSDMVLNNDFAPTFAELSGADAPGFVDGSSFARLLSGSRPQDWRSAFLVEAERDAKGRPAYEAVRTKDRLYVEYATGEKELYNLNEDPYQLDNLSGERPVEEAVLKERLETLEDCSADRCRSAEGFSP